jgi:hypothetical protein
MTCEEIRNLLGDHHAGELVVEIRESFEAHLIGCVDCTNFAASYRHVIKIVRKLPCCLPAGLEEKLRAALKEHFK